MADCSNNPKAEESIVERMVGMITEYVVVATVAMMTLVSMLRLWGLVS